MGDFVLQELRKPAPAGRLISLPRGHQDLHARLAEISGFSRSHFSRLFAQSEGMPPVEYVLLRRLRQSTRLLASGDHSVKEVTGMAGFADPNYLAKVFRRHFRVNPTEFKRIGLAASIKTMNAEAGPPALQKVAVEYPQT